MNPVDQLLDEPKTESSVSTDIQTILSRRSDLSTFIVHLTRDYNGKSAKENLESIVNDWKIEARSIFGAAKTKLEQDNHDLASQKCVCFTEAPLEYLYHMFGKIDDRDYEFAPYGIAITKMLARKKGVNPVWYIDITPGHDWLMNPINEFINQSVNFDTSQISKITPFIEQMGDNRPSGGKRKEFWWEREWRCVGDFPLPERVLLLCPENEAGEFERLAQEQDYSVRCIDPNWGIEKIIARLAGFKNKDIDIL